jgi:hypothetical protein
MRSNLALLFGAILVCAGCGQMPQVAPTIDDLADRCRNRQLAEEAWEHFEQNDPNHAYSPDYQAGFIDGYAGSLSAGGSGEPPTVPPRWSWRAEKQSPEGHKAVEDWFAGFKHGSAVAALVFPPFPFYEEGR